MGSFVATPEGGKYGNDQDPKQSARTDDDAATLQKLASRSTATAQISFDTGQSVQDPKIRLVDKQMLMDEFKQIGKHN